MKVKIGPYVRWIGPYQIAEKLLFWLDDSSDAVHRLGNFLAINKDGSDTRLSKICNWIHQKHDRRIRVKIDAYDTWNADRTMAIVIAPLLKKLKEDKQGAPNVDDEDVPAGLNLRSSEASPKENEYDTDDNYFKRFDWVLDEIIWTMTEIAAGKPTEEEFFDHSAINDGDSVVASIDKIKIDQVGINAYHSRIQNGCQLFGKYFQSMWT